MLQIASYKEVQLLNCVNLLLESAFPLNFKAETCALVCDAYVHHRECATCSDSHPALLQLLDHANYYLAPKFVIIPVSIEQYLLCGYEYHSIVFSYRLLFVSTLVSWGKDIVKFSSFMTFKILVNICTYIVH